MRDITENRIPCTVMVIMEFQRQLGLEFRRIYRLDANQGRIINQVLDILEDCRLATLQRDVLGLPRYRNRQP
jgi:hypothetical protein